MIQAVHLLAERLLVADQLVEPKCRLAILAAKLLVVADQLAELKCRLAILAAKLLDVQAVADQAAELKWVAAMHVHLLAAIAVADVVRSVVVVFSRRSSHATRRAAVMQVHAMHVLHHAAPARHQLLHAALARVLHRLQLQHLLLHLLHQHQLSIQVLT